MSSPSNPGPLPTGSAHIDALAGSLDCLRAEAERIDRWGAQLAAVLRGGGRLLATGNGGSAAQAQHLTAELVGRYRDDRPAWSAIALHAETSSLTAIANDFGASQAFARQVSAHGRAGDVLVALSTSGRSENVLAAVAAARERGLVTWAVTGAAPNPLAEACDDAVCVQAPATATVQELHQVVVHLLCAAIDADAGENPPRSPLRRFAAAQGRPRPPGDADPAPDPGSTAGPPARAPATSPPPTRNRRRGRALVVVGDALLDRDVDGTVERLCPDAPAPVVDDPRDRSRPGGAALAAALAAADGRPVTLVTALGEDQAGRELAALLDQHGIRVVDLGLRGPTPQKVRIRADGRVLARVDRGGPPAPTGAWSADADTALRRAGAVLVADYGRGLTARTDVRAVLSEAAGRRPLVWDPHPRGAPPIPGARLATPNRDEAARFAGGVPGEGLAAVTERARTLRRRWGAAGLAVTMGDRGALLVGGDDSPLVVPAPAATTTTTADACGAGDRFASAVAGLLADGVLPSEAVTGAVGAASAFVADGGAAAFRVEREPTTAVAQGPDADTLVAAMRAAGKTIVATGGCFDLLHAGHVRMLAAARALGDGLVVCLNSDASVRRLKGADRPLVPAADRAAVLSGLSCVDAVAVFDEDTPEVILDRLRPDIWAKGGDYAIGDLPEAAVVRRWGGEAVVLPYMRGHSTTDLIRRVTDRAHT